MIYDCYNYPPECIQEIERLKNQLQNLQWEKEKLEEKLKTTENEKDHLDFRIKHELEPRIQAEHRSYDAWVTTDRSAEACDYWQSLLDKMLAMIQDNPAWFDWEDGTGELDEKILFIIKHRDSVVISADDYDILKRS